MVDERPTRKYRGGIPNGRLLLWLPIAAVLVIIATTMAGTYIGKALFGDGPIKSEGVAEASHEMLFTESAVWEQPANPHPRGLECWILADPELGQNSPHLIWCNPQRRPQ